MALADCGEIPESVTLFCDGHEVAVLPCRLWGSIPLDPGRFIDPAEILRGSAPPAVGSFETGFRYRSLLTTLGFVLTVVGIFLAGGTFWSQGFEPSAGLLGDVHLRSDGLHLKEFHSDLSARRFAAQVAYSLGVRVLDTSESAG
jgi:hypothetical protein